MRLLLLASLLATGCTISVDVITKVDGEVRFELEGLAAGCGGSGTARSGDAVTTFTTRAEGSGCRLEVLWNGPFVDAGALRAKVDAEIRDEGYEPDEIDVTVDGIDVTFRAVALADGAGQTITPARVPDWSADLSIAGTEVAGFAGRDVTQLLEVPRTFPMPSPAVDECEDAFHEGRVVRGAGTASILLTPADLQGLAGRREPALVFQIKSVVYATASKRIL